MKKFITVILIAFIFAVAAVCHFVLAPQELEPERPVYGGTYRRVLLDDPYTLDPKDFNDRNSIMIASQIYDRLVESDIYFNIKPSIALSWNISKDRKRYTFQIRGDVYFNDGSKLTADDVVFSLRRLRKGGALIAAYLEQVEVKKKDDRTVIIELKEAFPPLLTMLASANASIISQKYYEEKGSAYFEHPIGTGPFYLRDWQEGSRIVLKANERYYNGRPYLDSVVYNKLNQKEAERLLLNGELEDIAPFRVLNGDPAKIGMKRILAPTMQTNIIYFNTKVKPFDDVRVRRAFIHAFNKDDFYSVIGDDKRVKAKGYIPRGMIGYDPYFEEYEYDIEKARKLLSEAGFPGGEGIGEISILRLNSYPYKQEYSTLLKKYYAAIGVDVKVVYVDIQDIIRSYIDNTAQMVNCEINLDIPETFFSLMYFHSKYKFGFTNVNNGKLDELLDKILFIAQKEERARIYKELDRIITRDEALLINLYYDDYFDGYYQDYVYGVEPSLLGVVYTRMNRVWISHND
jgi:peptide/nickel transport system substrate-binding protein